MGSSGIGKSLAHYSGPPGDIFVGKSIAVQYMETEYLRGPDVDDHYAGLHSYPCIRPWQYTRGNLWIPYYGNSFSSIVHNRAPIE